MSLAAGALALVAARQPAALFASATGETQASDTAQASSVESCLPWLTGATAPGDGEQSLHDLLDELQRLRSTLAAQTAQEAQAAQDMQAQGAQAGDVSGSSTGASSVSSSSSTSSVFSSSTSIQSSSGAATAGIAPAGGGRPQATFRVCAALPSDARQTLEGLIAQFIGGHAFSASLSGREDGCTNLTVSVAPQLAPADSRQSSTLSVVAGTPERPQNVAVRIASENGATQVQIG